MAHEVRARLERGPCALLHLSTSHFGGCLQSLEYEILCALVDEPTVAATGEPTKGDYAPLGVAVGNLLQQSPKLAEFMRLMLEEPKPHKQGDPIGENFLKNHPLRKTLYHVMMARYHLRMSHDGSVVVVLQGEKQHGLPGFGKSEKTKAPAYEAAEKWMELYQSDLGSRAIELSKFKGRAAIRNWAVCALRVRLRAFGLAACGLAAW